MGKITKYLNQLIVGNVFDSPEILDLYSTDRSALKIKPKFVAFPESTEDIRKLMRFFNQIAAKEIPVTVTVRGSGLDETGADLGTGLIVSTEKMNKMLEIDPRERLVRVQAGITLKELNTALSVSGLTIPIGGHDNETIGGLIANCPTDEYSEKYGGIYNFVKRVEVVLANGEILQTMRYRKYAAAKKTAERSLEGDIYRKIAKLISKNPKLIEKLQGNRVEHAGYPKVCDVMKKESMDLLPLFFCAQGTLGVVSEVILSAVLISRKPTRILATFKTLEYAIDYMNAVLPLRPRELKIYDLKIVQEARESGKNLDGVIKKIDDGFVVYLTFDERKNYYMRKMSAVMNEFSRSGKFVLDTPDNQLVINEFENSLATYLNGVRNGERVPVLTNFYIPGENLEFFVKDLEVLKSKLEINLELFGSYDTGIYSLRPKFDLEEEDYNKKMTTFLRAGSYIIKRQGGRLTGGEPEGRLKAVVTNTEMSDSEKSLYGDVKKLFDQNSILSPDVKLGAVSKFTLTHLRNTNSTKIML